VTIAPRRSSSLRPRLVTLFAVATWAACGSTPQPFQRVPLAGEPVQVETGEGTVGGLTKDKIHTFLGIPYAAPVGGIDRWLPPKPPAKRDGVFDATAYGHACEQTVASIPSILLTEAGEVTLYEMTDLEGFNNQQKSGDCLNLNIWTPSLPSDEPAAAPAAPAPVAAAEPAPATVDGGVVDEGTADGGVDEPAPVADAAPVKPAPAPEPARGLPVIVHLHGGGLTSGSAFHPAQDGSLLAAQGVVVVTINYRLGSIGFLAGDGLCEGHLMKGNRGFMDTVRALEWVRDNIAAFGGDPANVTLMGQSGGGTNVWSVLASPTSEGLVRRAVIMSGPIYDYPLEDHKKLTAAVLDEWGADVGDADALAKIEADDATSTTSTTTLVGSDEYGEMSRTYLPSAGAHGTDFLPETILEAVKKGRLNNIDLLVGSCADDAKVSIIMVPIPDSFAIDIWNGYIGGLIGDSDEAFEAMTEKYIAAMPEVSKTRAKEQLQTDALYRIRALKAADMHSEQTKDAALGKTYAYQFNFKSPTYPEKIAAMHGMDLVFGWGHFKRFPTVLGIKEGKVDPAQQKLSDGMLEALANFAKTGVPSSDKLPEWPEYDTGARNTMVFDAESQVVSDPGGKLRKLWE
jgi:para-nitrobenzyl esterase